MADIPALPPGFTLDAAPANLPLPAGFTLDAPVALRPAPTSVEHAAEVLNIAKQHPFTAPTGILENVLSGATGGLGSLADAVTLSEPGTHDWAYRPRTEAGKAIAQAAGDEAAALGRGYDKLPGGDTPLGQTIKRYGPEALGAVGTVAALPEVPGSIAAIGRNAKAAVTPGTYIPKGTSAQTALDMVAANSKQSMGAAAAAPRVTGASADLQQAIADSARKTGGAINPDVLARHLEADSLPVPVRLTAGQATQDPALISQEQNMRGKHTELANHFNAQNDQLIQNVQAIRDEIGPDVFSTNHIEHGDTLMGAYQTVDNAANDQINAAYKEARDLVPDKNASVMDAPSLLSNVTKALHEHDLFDSAPKDIMANLGRRAENGSMSFANIENMKTNLARIQRSISADGNTRYAAGVIRDQLEQMPLTVPNPDVQTAYNNARALARARFQAMDADPAYKAVVNDKINPDDFVRKFVINGKRDDVATMRQTLAADPPAIQTLGVSALDHLRDQAGIPGGNFSQAGYNKALRGLDPKLQALVGPQTAEQLQALGNVARNTQFQPRGSFVNNSNTLVGALADKAVGSLEGAANVAAYGVPIGTWGRSAIGKIRANREINRSLRPGAGLENLSTRDQIAKQMAP